MSVPYADNIIFNLTLFNQERYSIPVENYINRDQAFINNCEDYYLTLVGAEIPTAEIPLFKYNNDMTVRIDYNGISAIIPVTFQVLYPTVPNDVIFVQQFINGINQAFRTAHITAFAPGNAPVLVYQDEEMRILIDQQYTPNLVNIGFNTVLADKLLTFVTTYDGLSDYYFLVYGDFGINTFNTYQGSVNYPVYVLYADTKGYNQLQEFFGVVVTSSSIPINKQQIGTTGISTRTLGILDFIPISIEDITSNVVKVWTPNHPTYVDILNKGKLSEVDFKMFLIDKNFRVQELLMLPGASVTCRIGFVNKHIVKNFYPKDYNNMDYKHY